MKKPIIFTVLFLLSSVLVYAQGNTTTKPDSTIKIIPDGRHFLYTVGGKLVSPSEVRDMILNYPPAAAEYRLARTNATWTISLFTASAVSGLVAAVEYGHHGLTTQPNGTTFVNGQPTFTYGQPSSLTGAHILTGAAIGMLVPAIITWISANNHGNKAFSLFNSHYQ
jgi:hypothetical protein